MLKLETPKAKPPRILLYGTAGIGKTTFGATALNPVFIQTEDGLDAIEGVQAFPLATSFADVMDQIGQLFEQEHEFKTLVVDSVDWLETLIHKQVIAERPTTEKGVVIKSIDDYGYGKGYVYAMDIWQQYIEGLNALRDVKDMTIVQIAHSEIKRFENPETDGYDQYRIKLHKGAADKLMEHSDMVIFANFYVATSKNKEGFNEKTKAKGNGERVLYTEQRPAYYAKTRYNTPSQISFSKDGSYWATIAESIPYYKNLTSESETQNNG